MVEGASNHEKEIRKDIVEMLLGDPGVSIQHICGILEPKYEDDEVTEQIEVLCEDPGAPIRYVDDHELDIELTSIKSGNSYLAKLEDSTWSK